MGIKLPFPSLKGKTGGVKKSKWGSTLGSVLKFVCEKNFLFRGIQMWLMMMIVMGKV